MPRRRPSSSDLPPEWAAAIGAMRVDEVDVLRAVGAHGSRTAAASRSGDVPTAGGRALARVALRWAGR